MVSSQSIGYGDRDSEDSGIDKCCFRVSNCDFPLLGNPLVGIFLTVGIYQLGQGGEELDFVEFYFNLGFQQMKSG